MWKQIISQVCHRLTILQASRRYVRHVREPGINKRLKTFSDDFLENDPETIEAMEPDFMNVAEAHKQFESEEKQHQQKLSRLIVGRKYFNEKGINFLTWSEKEQIRQLSQQNPDEWTPSRLSEAFPADPLSITKIIKSNWTPRDEKRIQKHDESVIKSWEEFKAGKLEVDPMLTEHLKKFAHRDLNNMTKVRTSNRKLGTVVPKPSTNEFLSIITSCKKYSEDSNTKETLQLETDGLRMPKNFSRDPEQDSFLLEGKLKNSTSRMVPLSEYQKIAPDIVLPEKSKEVAQLEPFKKLKTLGQKEVSVVSLEFNEKKVYKSLEIKEEIRIPKNVWKKDKIYKVGDCFYADDGEFLYRVPGLN